MNADNVGLPQVGLPQHPPRTDRIPEELRAWPHWVNWRAAPAERPDKVVHRKIPIDPKTGRAAQTNDPRTWASFGRAAQRWEKDGSEGGFPRRCAGVGVILGEHEGVHLVGMDFDNCIHNGKVDEDIRLIISSLPGYVEMSPSGNGVKVFWFTTVDLSHLTQTGRDGKGRGREFYCRSARYFTVTGLVMKGRESMGEVIGADWLDMFDRSIESLVAEAMSGLEGTRAGGPVLAAIDGRLLAAGGGGEGVAADEDDEALLAALDRPVGWTLERVKSELLPQVGADCSYDEWFRVACALHHHGNGGEDWFEAFDEWSQTAPGRYPGEDGGDGTRAKWDSIGQRRRGAPVTLRSLIKMAGAVNAQAAKNALAEITAAVDEAAVRAIAEGLSKRDLDPLDREKAAHAIKARLKALGTPIGIAIARGMIRRSAAAAGARTVLDWAAELVYVTDERRWYDPRGSSYTAESLNVVFASKAPLLPPPLTGRMPPVKYVSEDVGAHIPVAASRRFRPDIPSEIFYEEAGLQYLNSYPEGLRYLPELPVEYTGRDREAIERVQEHLGWLLPDERERRLFWDTLCWIVQNPGRQLRWMPLLIGPVGAGKTFFESLLRRVMGRPEWVSVVSHDAFSGRFNGWAAQSLVVVLSEIRFPSDSSRYAMMDKLKPLLSDSELSIEAKGQDAYTTRNFTNYIAMSNYDDALPLEKDTRRVMAIMVSPDEGEIVKRAREGHFNRLFGVLEDHAGALRRWMLEHADWHPDFQPGVRAPNTVAREVMIAATEDPLVEEVREALAEGGDGFGEGAVVVRRLFDYLRGARGMVRLDLRRLKKTLRDLGYVGNPEDPDGSGFVIRVGARVSRVVVTKTVLARFPEKDRKFRKFVQGIIGESLLATESDDDEA